MAPRFSSSNGAPTTRSLKESPFRSDTGARADPKRAFSLRSLSSSTPSRMKRGWKHTGNERVPKDLLYCYFLVSEKKMRA